MTRRKKAKFDFWQVFGLVLGILIAIAGGCLGYLWQNLRLYEESMPKRVLTQFCYPIIQGGLPRLLALEAAKPAKYESTQERDSFIRALLDGGEMNFTRAPGESGGGRDVYLYRAGKTLLGAVTIEKVETGRFGWWKAVKEELRLPIYGDLRIMVPQGALVTVNGRELFDEDRIRSGLPYPELSRLSQDVIEQPLQDEYLLTGLYRKPEISAQGISGNPLNVNQTTESDGVLVIIIPVAPEEDFSTYEKMALSDALIYSQYLSNDAAFNSLGARMVRGTEIYRNMQLMETDFYTDHETNAFSNEKVHDVRLYSADCLTIDIDYTYTITRLNGRTHPFDTVVRFTYIKVEDQWLIADIILQQE